MKKNYEIIGFIECVVVVKAESPQAASDEVKGWKNAWVDTGKFHQLINTEIVDVRDGEEIADTEV